MLVVVRNPHNQSFWCTNYQQVHEAINFFLCRGYGFSTEILEGKPEEIVKEINKYDFRLRSGQPTRQSNQDSLPVFYTEWESKDTDQTYRD